MTPILELNNIRGGYGTIDVLHGVNLKLEAGQVYALLGPNGAGKSSMFNIMTMDMKRTEGQIKVMDINIDEMQVNEHGNKMGICPQANTIWKALTVDQSLKFIG